MLSPCLGLPPHTVQQRPLCVLTHMHSLPLKDDAALWKHQAPTRNVKQWGRAPGHRQGLEAVTTGHLREAWNALNPQHRSGPSHISARKASASHTLSD